MNDADLFQMVRQYARKNYSYDGYGEIKNSSPSEFNEKLKEELTEAKRTLSTESSTQTEKFTHDIVRLVGYMMFDLMLKELDKK